MDEQEFYQLPQQVYLPPGQQLLPQDTVGELSREDEANLQETRQYIQNVDFDFALSNDADDGYGPWMSTPLASPITTPTPQETISLDVPKPMVEQILPVPVAVPTPVPVQVPTAVPIPVPPQPTTSLMEFKQTFPTRAEVLIHPENLKQFSLTALENTKRIIEAAATTAPSLQNTRDIFGKDYMPWFNVGLFEEELARTKQSAELVEWNGNVSGAISLLSSKRAYTALNGTKFLIVQGKLPLESTRMATVAFPITTLPSKAFVSSLRLIDGSNNLHYDETTPQVVVPIYEKDKDPLKGQPMAYTDTNAPGVVWPIKKPLTLCVGLHHEILKEWLFEIEFVIEEGNAATQFKRTTEQGLTYLECTCKLPLKLSFQYNKNPDEIGVYMKFKQETVATVRLHSLELNAPDLLSYLCDERVNPDVVGHQEETKTKYNNLHQWLQRVGGMLYENGIDNMPTFFRLTYRHMSWLHMLANFGSLSDTQFLQLKEKMLLTSYGTTIHTTLVSQWSAKMRVLKTIQLPFPLYNNLAKYILGHHMWPANYALYSELLLDNKLPETLSPITPSSQPAEINMKNSILRIIRRIYPVIKSSIATIDTYLTCAIVKTRLPPFVPYKENLVSIPTGMLLGEKVVEKGHIEVDLSPKTVYKREYGDCIIEAGLIIRAQHTRHFEVLKFREIRPTSTNSRIFVPLDIQKTGVYKQEAALMNLVNSNFIFNPIVYNPIEAHKVETYNDGTTLPSVMAITVQKLDQKTFAELTDKQIPMKSVQLKLNLQAHAEKENVFAITNMFAHALFVNVENIIYERGLGIFTYQKVAKKEQMDYSTMLDDLLPIIEEVTTKYANYDIIYDLYKPADISLGETPIRRAQVKQLPTSATKRSPPSPPHKFRGIQPIPLTLPGGATSTMTTVQPIPLPTTTSTSTSTQQGQVGPRIGPFLPLAGGLILGGALGAATATALNPPHHHHHHHHSEGCYECHSGFAGTSYRCKYCGRRYCTRECFRRHYHEYHM